MKAIIEISEKTALLNGNDNAGKHVIDFGPGELTQDQRQALSICEKEDGAWNVKKPGFYIDGLFYRPAPKSEPIFPNFSTLCTLLDEIISESTRMRESHEKKKADEISKATEKLLKWASNPDKYIYINYRDNKYYPHIPNFEYTAPKGFFDEMVKKNNVVREAVEDAKSLAFWRNLEADLEKMDTQRFFKENQARKVEEQAARESRKKEQIAAWVSEHGTDNQKARLAENLLPLSEVKLSIGDAAFSPLSDFPLYQHIISNDVCLYDDSHEIETTWSNPETMAAEPFEQIKAMRSLMPDAVITLREYNYECEVCETSKNGHAICVEIEVGEFKFFRLFAI